MAVTIEEIARRAGVSAGTVSRILNGKNKENRPTIAKRAKRIRRIASEMGYRPNAAARSMIRGRFGLVALLTCGDLGFDWFAPSLLHGIHHSLESHDSRLVINEVCGSLLANPDYVPKLFQESAVDGVLVNVDTKLPNTTIPYFESQPFPTVLLNRKHSRRAVFPDEVMGGRLAAEHLMREGRRRIGYFKLSTPEKEPHYSVHDRHTGFRHAMESAGLSASRSRLGYTVYSDKLNNSVDCAESFIKEFPDVDGIVCYRIVDAIAMHAAMCRRGMRLGEDLDLIVFHEREIHSNTSIPMHTMIIPFKQVGIEAVNMIMATLEGGPEAEGATIVPYTSVYSITDGTTLPVIARE